MYSPNDMQSNLDEIKKFADIKGIFKIVDAISNVNTVKHFSKEMDIKSQDLSFWNIRLEIMESHGLTVPGLRKFVEDISVLPADSVLRQTIMILDEKSYLYCYRLDGEIFGVFLKDRRPRDTDNAVERP